jgi:hypothetical protein
VADDVVPAPEVAADTPVVKVSKDAFSSSDSIAKIQVPESVVLAESGTSGDTPVNLRQLTPTQQAGMWLAAVVGAVIVGVIAIVVTVWFQSAPAVPHLSADKAALDNYKALDGEAFTRVSNLFDLLATKALLPIFSAILGYIFGSREANKSKDA